MILNEDYFNKIELDDNDVVEQDVLLSVDDIRIAKTTYLLELSSGAGIDCNNQNDIKYLDVLEKHIKYAFASGFNTNVNIEYNIYPYTKYNQRQIICLNRQMTVSGDLIEFANMHTIYMYIYTELSDEMDILKSFDILTAALMPIYIKNDTNGCNFIIMSRVNIYSGLFTPATLSLDKIHQTDYNINTMAQKYYSRKKVCNMFTCMLRYMNYDFDYANILKLYKNKCGYNEGDRIMELYVRSDNWKYIGSGNKLICFDKIEKYVNVRSYSNSQYYMPIVDYQKNVPYSISKVMKETPYRVYEYYNQYIAIVFDGYHNRHGNSGNFYVIWGLHKYSDGCKLSDYNEDVIFDLLPKNVARYEYAALLVSALGAEKACEYVLLNHPSELK